MCECGCTSNDLRYWFPAPGNNVYILTLSHGCTDCDAPSGITIERIDKKSNLWRDREDYLDGELEFSKWPDSEGAVVITGMLKHEFVKALTPHLIETDLDELDEIGAEVLLEEAYEDSVTKPRIVVSAL